MFIIIGIVTVISILLLYYWGTRTFDYWKKRGVKHDTPIPFFGNNWKQFIQKASIGMTANEMYKKYPDEKVVGFYRAMSPELVIRDPEIVKRILITDFYNFYARGLNSHKIVIEPLLKNLFFADGDLWRLIRHRFSPAFSTRKINAMFPLITKRATQLQVIAEEICDKDFYDARELMARYTTDFIGECGFGINMDSLGDGNSQFRKLGKRIFERNYRDNIITLLKYVFPDLFKNYNLISPDLETRLNKLFRMIVEERNYKPSGRNDFIDLMLELKEKGNMIDESIELKNPDGSPKIIELELTESLMIAQAFVFFGAGFETSSTTSSFTLHQLAFNPDYQKKVQAEIDNVLKKFNNEITYEAVKEMKCLERAMYEAMRMYPTVGFLVRESTSENYTFPELNLTIGKNIKTFIPIAAIHNDEKYFPNPGKFDPDRFLDGAKDATRNYVFLPFGDGPRACVGARLGQMQSMAGIAAILQRFTVEPAACSERIPKPDPKGIVSEGFVGGLPLKFRKRVK